jgi:hypothetical protein
MVMEKPYIVPASGTGAYAGDGFSGRLNPGFGYKVDAVMINGFAKVAGFEFFGTLEHSQGRSSTEVSNRQFTQYAVDGIYRFGRAENLFVGARYNSVQAELKGIPAPVTIDRVAYSAGWFLTKNILLKGEYVTQQYKAFPAADYRSSGKFDGYVVASSACMPPWGHTGYIPATRQRANGWCKRQVPSALREAPTSTAFAARSMNMPDLIPLL